MHDADATGKNTNMKKKRAQDEFPITVKKGHAMVKIYQVQNRNRKNYTVSYVDAAGRKRHNFANLEIAKREAANIADNLNKGDLEALKLTGGDKQVYTQAIEAIAPTGMSLLSVAHDFARAFEILGKANIVEAANYYKKHVDVALPQIIVVEAVEKFHAAKESEGLSDAYLHDIEVLLGDFADHFRCLLSSVQPEDLREYLNS
jgi:hypothetical protein